MHTKPPVPLVSDDLEHLDMLARRVAQAHDLALTIRMRRLLRDALLVGMETAAINAENGGFSEDDSERRRSVAERAASKALFDFAETTDALIDRLRVEARLPPRPSKTLRDALEELD